MKCAEVRSWLSRKIDGELMDFENRELEDHLAQCARCTREYRLLMLPHQVVESTPAFAPSPFFYQKLRARIESEIQRTAEWQPLWGLARRMIPALAGITLAILSVFAYHELRVPEDDLHRAYNRVFISESLPHQMIFSEQQEISNENVLNIIAEREFNNLLNMSMK
jgi:anti-sigma factor RsiW